MAHDGDDLRDLSYLANADLKLGLTERDSVAPKQKPDTRESAAESFAESAVLPRESAYGPPPPVPAKDSIYVKRKVETTEGESASAGTGQGKLDVKTEDDSQQEDNDSSDLARWTSATSAAITIGITASTLNIFPMTKLKPAIPKGTMSTPHPLGMSPPDLASPIPEQVSIPAPTRPARPSSLRLSSLTRDGPLTTDRVVIVDSSRPSTSRSQRSQLKTSYTTYSASTTGKGGRIKYGWGKYATTELIPQPSDDPEDPLVRKRSHLMRCQAHTDAIQSWSNLKKELNLYALLTTVALCNVMKTALISVNEDLAQRYSVSYTRVAALTGVPLMLSAITGLASSVVARIWGRRPVFLASMILIFIGLVWNTRVTTSYGQFMAARTFQGFGWGAFDTLVVGSIIDTYFVRRPNSPFLSGRL